MLRRVLPLTACLALAAPLAAAHGPGHGGRGAPEMGSALPEEQRVYYLDLFSHVAVRGAFDFWRELNEGVEQLSKNTLTQAEADALYATVSAAMPVVRVRWTGANAVLLAAPPLELAVGLDREVLVEIENATGGVLTFQGEVPGHVPSNFAWTPPGATHAVLVQALESSPSATQLVIAIHAGAASDTVALPIVVVQPATLFITLQDADLGQVYPGRIWVRGVDQQYRHAAEFASNSTLTLKKIPGSTPWCELCPAGNREYVVPFSYSSGQVQVTVPPGPVTATLERGFEHDLDSQSVTLAPGGTQSITLASGRFVDMRALGWISGETHVHWVKNWWYENEDLALLSVVQRAEDVRVVNNLTLRARDPILALDYTKPDQEPMGTIAAFTDGDYVVQMAEEYRNDPYYGHLNLLNLTSFLEPGRPAGTLGGAVRPHPPSGLVQPVSTGDLIGPFAEDYPVNYQVIDVARSQRPPSSRPIAVAAHGIVGAFSGEIPADIVLGRIDSVDQAEPADYYRILDCGLRLPLTDGADHPARLVGETRCYVKTSGPLKYGRWIDGVLSGATFVTSGPLLTLTVEGVDPGGEVQVASGTQLDVHVEAYSRSPLGRVQVVSNGQLLYDQIHPGTSAVIDFQTPADVSRWIVARCSADPAPTFRPLWEVDAAHTSAVYAVVDGAPIFVDSGAAEFLRDLCDAAATDIFQNGTFHAPGAARKRREARDWFLAGRDAYQAILDAQP